MVTNIYPFSSARAVSEQTSARPQATRWRLSRSLACVAVGWVLLAIPARGDFFVAPTGSDANSGTKSKPFATLERARDAVRTRKASQSAFREHVTIWLHGGDYFRTNSLELTAADSGAAKAQITWRAYEDERVRILGGRTLTGFTRVTDPAILARFYEQARGHIVQQPQDHARRIATVRCRHAFPKEPPLPTL